jgi:serine/threonine-protein kinase
MWAARSWLILAAVSISWASPAAAEERDPAAAQALFDQGRQLMKAGRYADACSKLAESNRLDPGIGTQFHLADCYEQSGKVASAWAAFLEVASLAQTSGQADRERVARKRAAKLEPRLPRLEISVSDANRVEGLEIRRDGVLMGPAQWGTPLPIDPGEHEIVARAPGRQTLAQTLRLEEGKTASFELPMLALISDEELGQSLIPHDSAPPSPPKPVSNAPAPAPEPATTESRGPSALVWGLAGVGAIGIGVGTVFALKASSTNQDSKEKCRSDSPNVCDSDGVALRNDALDQGNIATVGFAVGGAALAGAITLFLLDSGKRDEKGPASSRLKPNATFDSRSAALGVTGSF